MFVSQRPILEAVCIDSLLSEFKGTRSKNNLRFIAVITKFILVNEVVKNRNTSPYIKGKGKGK